jgi:hypothetical protein
MNPLDKKLNPNPQRQNELTKDDWYAKHNPDHGEQGDHKEGYMDQHAIMDGPDQLEHKTQHELLKPVEEAQELPADPPPQKISGKQVVQATADEPDVDAEQPAKEQPKDPNQIE